MKIRRAEEEAELEKTGLERGLEVLNYENRMRRVPAKPRFVSPLSSDSSVGVGGKVEVGGSRAGSSVAVTGPLSGLDASKYVIGSLL
jgi:hypothetical protein